MANKFSLNFDGFLALAEKIDSLGEGALQRATENALKATDQYVTSEVEKAVASSKYDFERTGKTKQSMDKDIAVEWEGTKASASAGFHISKGGLPSIFLMYGTPHIKADTKLKNASKGTGKHRKEIDRIQQEAFNKVLEEAMEGGDR